MVNDKEIKGRVIRMSKLVNPHFRKLWNTKCPYIIAKGGRGSFKSSTISLKLATMMKKYIVMNETANVICLRDVANYLRDSVYQQMSWALNMLDMYDEFRFYTSPLRITHKRTGSTFYFYGVDDPMKLKSNIVGNVIAIWYEEAANFKSPEDFDQTNPTFVRQKHPLADQVKIFYSYNPPKNPYDWINEWIEQLEEENNERREKGLHPRYFIDTSTYLDDELGINSEQTLADIEHFKKNDYDYYRWLYLGEVVGLGTNIYNMNLFNRIEDIPDDDYIIEMYISADTGHEVSATACSCYALTRRRKVILLDTYYYSPAGKPNKKSPKQLSDDLHHFVKRMREEYGYKIVKMTMDSAEGALRNQYFKDYGVRWHPVQKLKKVDMIDRVQNLLAQGRFFYLPTENNLKYFIPQHQKYQWQEDTLESEDPKVIKEDDHTCDNFQYMCRDNERDLGLKY